MFVFFLLKKAKKEYYDNLDLYNATGTKDILETIKPVFGNSQKYNTISLIEKSTVITLDKALAIKPYTSFLLT